MSKIKTKDWVHAFILGVFGSIIFKGVELLLQLAMGWSVLDSSTWYLILLSQFIFLFLVAGLATFLIMKTTKAVWAVAFVPMIYYAIKELFNMAFQYHHFAYLPLLESLIGLPIGFGLFYLTNKLFKLL